MATWLIERLSSTHERAPFRCGHDSLDTCLKTLVSQHEKRGLGRTYVATRENERRVYGYYTACAGSVSVETLPERARRKLPKHPVPTAHLARFAVDLTVQGQGLGRVLLFHFLHQAVLAAQTIGIHAVDVFAIDDTARDFYLKFGFLRLEDDAHHLLLAMKSVEKMFASDEG